MVKGIFWRLSETNAHISKKTNCEIANIFGGFWEISNFLLLEIHI
jgi:hypothetical protein